MNCIKKFYDCKYDSIQLAAQFISIAEKFARYYNENVYC